MADKSWRRALTLVAEEQRGSCNGDTSQECFTGRILSSMSSFYLGACLLLYVVAEKEKEGG